MEEEEIEQDEEVEKEKEEEEEMEVEEKGEVVIQKQRKVLFSQSKKEGMDWEGRPHNHPSSARCLAKSELTKVPLMESGMR